MRDFVINASVALVSLIVGYCVLEVAYRIYERVRVERLVTATNVGAFDFPVVVADDVTGYRNGSGAGTMTYMRSDGTILFRTHVAFVDGKRRGIPLPQGSALFRIAVIGDSFTANTMSSVAWTDVAEEALSNDPQMQEYLHGRRVQIDNLGRNGFGTLNFADVVRAEAAGYDLVVVAPIWADLLRAKEIMKPVSLTAPDGISYNSIVTCGRQPSGEQACATGGQFEATPKALSDRRVRAEIGQDLVRRQIAALPWFELYPDLLARATAGFDLLPSHISPSGLMNLRQSEWISANRQAFAEMRRDVPNVMFLHIPTPNDLENAPLPGVQKIRVALVHDGVRFIDVTQEFSAAAKPMERFFNLPWDSHFNDAGAKLFGILAAKQIRQRILEH